MTERPEPGAAQPLLHTLGRHLELAGLDLLIDPADAMVRAACAREDNDRETAEARYVQQGWEIAEQLERVAREALGGLARAQAVLDFGCGHGRVVRHLVRRLPAERLWACEIDRQALAFVARRFRVHALPSADAPADFTCDRRFDLIYVGSLFTHLPASSFGAWLERLAGLLLPGGLLLFSVHDQALLPPADKMPRDGIFFVPRSESAVLAGDRYGSTWVAESFVRGAAAAIPRARLRRLPRGLCGYQDLYLLAVGDAPPLEALRLDAGPQGMVDRAVLHAAAGSAAELALAGWAVATAEGETVDTVSAWWTAPEGNAHASTAAFTARPDLLRARGDGLPPHDPLRAALARAAPRAGFELRLRLAQSDTRRLSHLVVEARCSSGSRRLLVADRLERLLLRVARENEHALRDRALELERLLAAMRASRFWRLRERWFAAKRRLGLTEEE